MKIAFIVCYKYPDYVRSEVLLRSLKQSAKAEVLLVKNKRLGLVRYFEVSAQLIKLRFVQKPDVYFINFRGYEVLLLAVLLRIKQPIIFDEFINFTEWMVEHKRFKVGSVRYLLFTKTYSWFVKHAQLVLADTPQHAEYSARLNHLPIDRYLSIPVSANESIFFANKSPQLKAKNEPYRVFYYGHMLPLHGLRFVLEAAVILSNHKDILFIIVGGGTEVAALCKQASVQGAHITYSTWLPAAQLADEAKQSSVTLGGPFGGTLQSNFVVTGKTYQFLALKKPVIIGQNEANAYFSDRKNCLIVPQQSALAIAEAIRWAYSNPGAIADIAEQGYELYHEKFSNEQITKIVKKIVDQLAIEVMYNH